VSEVPKKISEFFAKRLKNLPRFWQCKYFFKVLSQKEKIIFAILSFCFVSSAIFLGWTYYFEKTEIRPTRGGAYIEGEIGQPRFINPVLATSDIDRDLVEVLFSGLMKYSEKGEIVPDLAESFKIQDDGRTYEVTLKENIFWHDGQEITADDIIFTVKTIQNPDYKSPEITNWVGVTIEKISKVKVVFKLKNPYFPFLERLTLKILPKHIFGEISPENFAIIPQNIQPVGSGPFKFKEIRYNKLGGIESFITVRNQNYYGQKPLLDQFSFRFYNNKEELYRGFTAGEIHGLALSEPKDVDSFKIKNFSLYQISLPRYFAVFFNQEKNEFLKKKEVREALSLINKSEILERVVNNYGKIVFSPILPEIYGFATVGEETIKSAEELLKQAGLEKENGKLIKKKDETTFSFKKDLELGSRGEDVGALQRCLLLIPDIYPEGEISNYFGKLTQKAVINFQEKYKEEILLPQGLEKGTGKASKATRTKLEEICNGLAAETEPVKFSLVTINQPFLVETAELLKSQWEKLGIETTVTALSFTELSQNFIKPREYEMLLFGEILNIIPDPFTFWHSSRIKDPGLNLALYQNTEADKFLEKAREAKTAEELRQNLEEFQKIIVNDYPAIFLYSPDFLYLTSKKIEGIKFGVIVDPAERFVGIENWYMKTGRTFK